MLDDIVEKIIVSPKGHEQKLYIYAKPITQEEMHISGSDASDDEIKKIKAENEKKYGELKEIPWNEETLHVKGRDASKVDLRNLEVIVSSAYHSQAIRNHKIVEDEMPVTVIGVVESSDGYIMMGIRRGQIQGEQSCVMPLGYTNPNKHIVEQFNNEGHEEVGIFANEYSKVVVIGYQTDPDFTNGLNVVVYAKSTLTKDEIMKRHGEAYKEFYPAQKDALERKEPKHKILANGFFGLTILSLGYSALNVWNMHTFDKYVIKQIEIAANVPSVSSSESTSDLSMETSLRNAKSQLNVSRLENPAIIWKTPLTEISTLDDLLEKSIERSKQIGQLQESFRTGKVQSDAPQWVKDAHSKLDLKTIYSNLSQNEADIISRIIPTLTELADSEYGQRIGSEYEALNTVVAGGTRTQGKSLSERNRSLLDTLSKASGWRSIIRFQADDYKNTHAHVFIGYLMANMGYLSEGLKHFHEAKKLMDKYPDNQNLAIIRDTPELNQKTIKDLINSSIIELEKLDKDSSKYSTGWWKRLRYYNQSIGGQVNPSIQDVSEEIYGRYSKRFFWTGILGLGFFFLAGRFNKRLRNAKKYEVEYEDTLPK